MMPTTPTALIPELIVPAARPLVVAEARSWIGTSYHRRAFIKGVGVDCGLLPYAVYRKFDLVPEFEIDAPQDDWFNHTTQERYLLMVQRYLRKLAEGRTFSIGGIIIPPPASMLLARVAGSRVFNHSGIVTAWPRAVHATRLGVMEVNVMQDPMWVGQEVAVYDPWGNRDDK